MCVQPDTNSDCESIQGSYLSHIITQHGLPIMNYHLASVDLNYPSLKCIHSNPPVFEINNFLSPQQCSNLINNAQSSQSLGGLGLSQTMSGSKIASTRTSSTCYLPHETVSVSEVVNLAKLLTGVPIAHYEELQICRYTVGQQYSWHYDSIPMLQRKGWGNRIATLIIYLNDLPEYATGCTNFKDLDLKVRPAIGKALLFFPAYRDGTQDDRVLHGGEVAGDTKWIANIWMHEGTYEGG